MRPLFASPFLWLGLLLLTIARVIDPDGDL